MKKLSSFLIVLLFIRAALGDTITFTMTNSVGQPDTNRLLLTPVSSYQSQNGTYQTRGLPFWIYPNAGGFVSTNLGNGFWKASNSVMTTTLTPWEHGTWQGYIFNVVGSGGTYPFTTYPLGGYNVYAPINGIQGVILTNGFSGGVTNNILHLDGSGFVPIITYGAVTNALGFPPISGAATTNAITNIVQNIAITSILATNGIAFYTNSQGQIIFSNSVTSSGGGTPNAIPNVNGVGTNTVLTNAVTISGTNINPINLTVGGPAGAFTFWGSANVLGISNGYSEGTYVFYSAPNLYSNTVQPVFTLAFNSPNYQVVSNGVTPVYQNSTVTGQYNALAGAPTPAPIVYQGGYHNQDGWVYQGLQQNQSALTNLANATTNSYQYSVSATNQAGIVSNSITSNSQYRNAVTNNAVNPITFNSTLTFGPSGYIVANGPGISDIIHSSGGYGSVLASLGNANGVMWTNNLNLIGTITANGVGLTNIPANQTGYYITTNLPTVSGTNIAGYIPGLPGPTEIPVNLYSLPYDMPFQGINAFQGATNFSLALGQQGTNFAYLVGNNGTNWGLVIGQNATNFSFVVSNSLRSFSLTIGANDTNWANQVSNSITALILTIGQGNTNFSFLVSNSLLSTIQLYGTQGTNWGSAISNSLVAANVNDITNLMYTNVQTLSPVIASRIAFVYTNAGSSGGGGGNVFSNTTSFFNGLYVTNIQANYPAYPNLLIGQSTFLSGFSGAPASPQNISLNVLNPLFPLNGYGSIELAGYYQTNGSGAQNNVTIGTSGIFTTSSGDFIFNNNASGNGIVATGNNQFIIKTDAGVMINTNQSGGHVLNVNGDINATNIFIGNSNVVAMITNAPTVWSPTFHGVTSLGGNPLSTETNSVLGVTNWAAVNGFVNATLLRTSANTWGCTNVNLLWLTASSNGTTISIISNHITIATATTLNGPYTMQSPGSGTPGGVYIGQQQNDIGVEILSPTMRDAVFENPPVDAAGTYPLSTNVVTFQQLQTIINSLTNVSGSSVFSSMIMGQCTNPVAYLNSNIYIAQIPGIPGTNLYSGTYTNATALPSGPTAFGLWFQARGSNYITLNNPQWNSDAGSSFCITIGVQTNGDTDGNEIGNDPETGNLSSFTNFWQSTEWFCAVGGPNAGTPFPVGSAQFAPAGWPIELNYGAPVMVAASPASAVTNVWYVSSRNGSDYFDGKTPQTAKALFSITGVYLATNPGSIIYMGNGYQLSGSILWPEVSVIGPGASSNLCWINGDVNCEGNCTIANLAFYSEGQLLTSQYSHNWSTNGPTVIRDCYINAQGQEPFWTESSMPTVLPYPTEFLNDEIYGAASWGTGSNILIKNCTFRQPTPSGGNYGFCGMILSAGQGGPEVQWEGNTFIVGSATLDGVLPPRNAVIGYNSGTGAAATWTNYWGQGNSFNTNAAPGAILVTNGATIKMGTF